MKKTALVILLYMVLFCIGLTAQNTKPITAPDSLTMSLNDSLSINLLANDYDQQGDPMKITKFDRFTVSTFKAFKNDTGTFYINKNGRVSVKGLKVGVFTYKYIVQDGKAGAGRTGLFTLIVKEKQQTTNDSIQITPFCATVIIADSCGRAWVSSTTGIYLYGTLNDTSSSVPEHFRYGMKGDKIYSGYPHKPGVTIRNITWFSLLSREQYLFIANYKK